jgi:hypothetical protein
MSFFEIPTIFNIPAWAWGNYQTGDAGGPQLGTRLQEAILKEASIV